MCHNPKGMRPCTWVHLSYPLPSLGCPSRSAQQSLRAIQNLPLHKWNHDGLDCQIQSTEELDARWLKLPMLPCFNLYDSERVRCVSYNSFSNVDQADKALSDQIRLARQSLNNRDLTGKA